MDNKQDEFVNVSLRIRPSLNKDNTENSCLEIISKEPPVLLVLDRSQTYNFDNIFAEDVEQEVIYNKAVKPLVKNVKQGYNCTVFAYGQTGTGKTYTMGANYQILNEKDVGLIPRTLDQFFACYEDDTEVDISISFIEIYNEKVFDLLQNANNPPLPVKGFTAQELTKEKVYNSYEAKHFLQMGSKNRHTSGTKQNLSSSRSHAIFTVYCNVKYKDHETNAKLNLVDLAGCESVRKTGNQGSTFQEGVNINKGLLCIGQVMTALCENLIYIPYRQSIITTILRDSLNKKNYISLIACVKSNPDDLIETVQTLEFAHRVKKMKNKPEVNEIVLEYKREHPDLFNTVKITNTPFKKPSTTYYQTPHPVKKPKNVSIEVTKNSTVDYSSKSLLSMSLSSVSSNFDVTQQNCISPVIKKYMCAMESSLMNKLEMTIKSALSRSTRHSDFRKEKQKNQITPSLSWNKIQNEVTKLIRTEIAQLSVRSKIAASSPIEETCSLDKVKKILNYESPILCENLEENGQKVGNITCRSEKQNIDVNFKVPEVPICKRKDIKDQQFTSLLEPAPVLRRSVRLSLRNNINSPVKSNTFLEPEYLHKQGSYECAKRRCSKRLSRKCKEIQKLSLNDNHLIYGNWSRLRPHNNNNDLLTNSNIPLETTTPTKFDIYGDLNSKNYTEDELTPTKNDINAQSNKKFKTNMKRNPKDIEVNKTIRDTKTNKLKIRDTPIGKKLLNNPNRRGSPSTTHTKYVMNILNSGTVKQLQTLHRIGPKTAQQVLLFREINRPINKISDLLNMPGWSEKKFHAFVAQNFLKKELL